MAVTITAALVGVQIPPVVQVVVSGLTVGDNLVITGETAQTTWVVRGGDGIVADATQVIRLDNLTPINGPITYRAIVNGSSVATSSPPIVVPYDGNVLLASLDGSLRVAPKVWQDNALPTKVAIDQHFSRVPGRRNPVVRFARAGGTAGEWTLRLDDVASSSLAAMLGLGAPIVLRSDGAQRGLPAVNVVALTDGSSSLWGERGTSTDRVWALSWMEIDPPFGTEPLPGDTFADVDAAHPGTTFADLDAAYPGSTFSAFNQFDWAS
jgi:hypothetical protein